MMKLKGIRILPLLLAAALLCSMNFPELLLTGEVLEKPENKKIEAIVSKPDLTFPRVVKPEPKPEPPAPAKWYTEEDAQMMAYIIQQEVRGASLMHKRIIANVILNRVRSKRFPNTIAGVLQAPNQFTSLANWKNRTYEPDADTWQAVREVLDGTCEDLSGGALFFYAPRWASSKAAGWFETLTFVQELEGHRFFR